MSSLEQKRNRKKPLLAIGLMAMLEASWMLVGVGAVFTLASFSEDFLILPAKNGGLPIALAPVVLVVMNIVYALSAYPLGALSDRLDRK